MAGSKKKRNIEHESSAENSENESENMDIDTTIEADFEGRNPDQSDFHGIQQLLKQLFLKAHINLSQFCDMIIGQQGLGSVLKQSIDDYDDDNDDLESSNDVFGVTTALNLTANDGNDCVKQLYELLKSLANEHADKEKQLKLTNILEKNKIGLLINERFINIPAKIADPLLESLLSEINRIKNKNPAYNFDYFLMICKTYKQLNKNKQEEEYIFINAEEEIFSQNSELFFEFSVEKETDMAVSGRWTEDDKQMIPHRRVLLFPVKKLPEIVQNVKKFVS